MPDSLDHLQWSRLELEPMTRPRQAPGRRPPLRPDPQRHGLSLADETQEALAGAGARRQDSGVDPARLLVLRTRFLGTAQQEHLARLGVQVVEEREERQALDSPVYELLLRFSQPYVRDAFQQHADYNALGVTATQDVRGSGGEVDPVRLIVCFPDLDRAKAFEQSGRSRCPIPFDIQGKPRRVASSVQHLLMVQFSDLATQNRFLTELAAYRRRDSTTLTLTASQRAELFDALESIERPGPEDRRGARLGKEGPPAEDLFYLDVDLWHPGSPSFVLEAIEQLRSLVGGTGGVVTSNVLPLQHTLLIARVRATAATLEALLNYDRVSRVDLPPLLERVRFTIFDAEPRKAEGANVPDDGPLACLVDSGVVSGHPLLQGLVVDERDFDSGEHNPVDQVGHGTHLAGIIVYGDVYSCLQSGEPWLPRVRLLSAKVLRRVEEGFGGEWVRPGFEDEKRAEEQIRDAITAFAHERRCRVFNLSVGNPDLPLTLRHQLPWALLLDELAHALDIVIVVSAGNVASPAIPTAASQEEFQQSVRDQLFSSEHTLIDPACAVNTLTVGAISRNEVPQGATGAPEARPDFVGSPKDCPAPFTRTGLLGSSGRGPCRAVKPELVAYGGNLVLLPFGDGRWRENDPVLGEPSLYYDFNRRLLSVACGTSVAAPYVTHVCSLVEHRLRQLMGERSPSANLIRALAAHSAEVPHTAREWVSLGASKAEDLCRERRVLGFGMPDPYRACYSDNNRAVLMTEDVLAERHFHLYGFELPGDFLERKGVRCIRVTLAFDPPVRGTRLEYMSRTMTMQLFQGVTKDQIQRAVAKLEGDAAAVKLSESKKHLSPTMLEWSTVQLAVVRSRYRTTFECRKDSPSVQRLWHVLVGCKHRFPTEETETRQRYALVVSLEHSDGLVQIYQPLREQIAARVHQRATLSAR